jgi:glycosyltransferase involved in cell wall biosynthesis
MASFIRKDLDILAKEWEILAFEVRQGKPVFLLVDLLKQLLFLFRYGFQAKRLVCMFGGYHSFLPALFGNLFGIPSWIMPGGYDCYAFPDIQYGAFNKKVFGLVVAYSYRWTDLISPVHKSMVNQAYTYYDSGHQNQGFGFFVPGLKTPVLPINNGYEPDKFYPLHKKRIPNSFLTVARDTSGPTFFRKGIDLVLAVAPHFPDYVFTIIGKNQNQEIALPANVQFLPPVPYKELIEIYNQHEFYLQLSVAEGFPNALSEAMLCGCIPIGSNVFGIPDLIDETGLLLMNRDVDQLKALLQKASGLNREEMSEKATDRVSRHFLLSQRESQMLTALKNLSKKP